MIGWGIDTLVSTTCIVMNLLTCLFLITYNELRQREIYIERERELRFCLKSSSLLEINSSVAYHTRLQFTKTHKLNNGTFDLQSSQNRPKYFYFATLCKQQVVRTFFLTIIKYDPCNFKALLCNYFLQSRFLYD